MLYYPALEHSARSADYEIQITGSTHHGQSYHITLLHSTHLTADIGKTLSERWNLITGNNSGQLLGESSSVGRADHQADLKTAHPLSSLFTRIIGPASRLDAHCWSISSLSAPTSALQVRRSSDSARVRTNMPHMLATSSYGTARLTFTHTDRRDAYSRVLSNPRRCS